jgi:hypothetical protein
MTTLWDILLSSECTADFVLGAELGLVYAVLAAAVESPDETHCYELARKNADLVNRVAEANGWAVTWEDANEVDSAIATFTRASPFPRPKLQLLRSRP